MNYYPPITLTLLNGFLLTLPMIALRYGIPAWMKKEALAELDYFPPVEGLESLGLKIYFITNTFLIFSPLLAAIKPAASLKAVGWPIYLSGIILLAAALVHYCWQDGLKTRGLFQYSRNPVCMGYLLIFAGTAVLISSWCHLILTIIYQGAVHLLILSEERWCLKKFGDDYQDYLDTVPRYFIR